MKKYLFIMAQEGHRWGGSEPLWSSAAEYLARKGNDVRVSAKDWGAPVPQIEHLRAAGCKIFYRTGEFRIPTFIPRQFEKIFPPAPYRETHVRSIGSDTDLIVISVPDNTSGIHWIEAARATGRKYAIIAQSAVVYWWPEDDRAEKLAALYENASASYFVSQAILDISRLQFGTPLENAKVVRNAFYVNYDASPPWRTDSEVELALAFVGRLDVISKGQDILLQVLALPHWRQRSVRVSLIGEGQNERGLRRIAQQLQLTNVDFPGATNDVEGIWAKHHALVLPSRFEGMPLVVIEAMLCGRACIATDVGGNRELIRNNVNGFLAKAPTVELFDEAMNRAWENRQQLDEIGRIAAKDVRQWISREPGADLARELSALAEGRAATDGTVGAPNESVNCSR